MSRSEKIECDERVTGHPLGDLLVVHGRVSKTLTDVSCSDGYYFDEDKMNLPENDPVFFQFLFINS